MILAKARVTEARRIVAKQRILVSLIKNGGVSEARKTLQMYESSLRHLEEHEQLLLEGSRAKTRETKKRKSE